MARTARSSDARAIHALLSQFVADGHLLPRTLGEVQDRVRDFAVVEDANRRVVACASLHRYSPTLAEVAAVAVAPEAQGLGLGTMAVQAVEAAARRSGVDELFAMTRAERFFEAMGYDQTSISRFPQKLEAYRVLRARGIPVLPKTCVWKTLD